MPVVKQLKFTPLEIVHSYYLYDYDKVAEISNGVYTHVSTRSLGEIRSPLDNLNLEDGDIDKI